jgi:hypothetical protein
MPSRVLVGPQGLRDHLAEPTASPTQHDKENVPLPVLQEVEIVYDTEQALDCQGRKHFDREANVQQYYIGQSEDPFPSYQGFPMPGLASADALRASFASNCSLIRYLTNTAIYAISQTFLTITS